MISATSAETSDALSRRSFTSASKAAANPGSEASSRRMPNRLPECLDQCGHFGRMQLEGRAIDDQSRGHLADHRLLGERILDQRAPRRNQIDNMRGEPELRRNFHRAVEFDAFGLNALPLEPAARGRGIFGRNADMALAQP